MGEARQILAGGIPNEAVIFDLALESGILAEQDERVQAAFARWSECMAAGGFNYGTPWDANDDQWGELEVSERERAVATADVECKHETNLVGVWSAVEAAYQQRLIERYAEQLTELKDTRSRMLSTAAEVIAAS